MCVVSRKWLVIYWVTNGYVSMRITRKIKSKKSFDMQLDLLQHSSKTRDMDYYPDCDQPWLWGDKLIPPLVNLFISQLMWNPLKQSGTAQAVIQAAWPRSCIMPILFALAIEIHKQHGAAELVKVLSRWVFCMSLDEVHQFHQAVMVFNGGWQPKELSEARCTQCTADNVDHNLRTLTGCDTFCGVGLVALPTFPIGTIQSFTVRIKRLSQN